MSFLEPLNRMLGLFFNGVRALDLAKGFPWVGPALLAAGCAGMGLRARQLALESRGGEVGFKRLRAIDIKAYVPWLTQNLRGHDDIVRRIVESLQENLLLSKEGRTLGAYLLVGPTGTGKTFLAQLMAEALYPGTEPLVLRMNQYKHSDDVYTLLGPPPGIPGFELGGALTRPVIENPHRVVVLDELEKAHRDIHHCLYDILDAASCREKSSGKTVSFAGCVFFATSNAAVETLRGLKEASSNAELWRGKSRDALSENGQFEKAFLARWDGLYFMDELAPLHVAEVACLKLAKHWREYGIEVTFTSPAVILEAVQKNAEFKEYGVRQLGSYIDSKTNGAIAESRRRGVSKVSLDITPAGEIVVSPAGPS